MLVIVSSSKLNFDFTFDQKENEVLEGLRSAFVDKFGEDAYSKAAKIIVVEKHFLNVIKDRYGPPIIGDSIEVLDELIDSHILV